MSQSEDLKEIIKKIVRDSSLSRMKNISRRDDIKSFESQAKLPVLGHWMSFILLAGGSLRILFKAHYQSEAAKFFASRSYDIDREKVSQVRALDFFREFCNLTAGHIKLVLMENDVKVGISLPILARGFDDLFYPRSVASFRDQWVLSCQGEKVICSAEFEILEDITLKPSKGISANDEGEVEFF